MFIFVISTAELELFIMTLIWTVLDYIAVCDDHFFFKHTNKSSQWHNYLSLNQHNVHVP
jgi:type IV secretory pathway VirB3-like protein